MWVSNYDGLVAAHPSRFVEACDVEHLQEILRDRTRYPGPVRAKGSFHSLTPCASTEGTMVDMIGLSRVLRIDPDQMTVTAQAGAQLIDVARQLGRRGLQFILNVEIGNITLGSAACCQTKDGLDGVEYGQLNSYATEIKWVDPSGELQSASEDVNPELLRLVRSSYGLCGIVYEVTFRVKPIERVRFRYRLFRSASLTQARMDRFMDSNQGVICWTVRRTTVVQTRNREGSPGRRPSLLAAVRRLLWGYLAAYVARGIERFVPTRPLRRLVHSIWMFIAANVYRFLSFIGGMTLTPPERIVDYAKTPPAGRYAFSYWAFPREAWVENLHAYFGFAEDFRRRTGFRCNMPVGAYFIRHDTSSILSYTYDGDTFSIDPVHAVGPRDKQHWEAFLREFGHWSSERGGIPLLNQSPWITKEQVQRAFGRRWTEFSNWIRSVDPEERMLNPFFRELLE